MLACVVRELFCRREASQTRSAPPWTPPEWEAPTRFRRHCGFRTEDQFVHRYSAGSRHTRGPFQRFTNQAALRTASLVNFRSRVLDSTDWLRPTHPREVVASAVLLPSWLASCAARISGLRRRSRLAPWLRSCPSVSRSTFRYAGGHVCNRAISLRNG